MTGIMVQKKPETPLIRPPSEWRSLLVRVTRGCRWNRCRFCGIYPALGEPGFSRRSAAEIKEDIDLLLARHPRARTAFFGDGDPLEAGLEVFVEVARYLRSRLPVERLTCYARASTLHRLGREGVQVLARAGLNRVHMGLESGDPETLRFHRKGQSPEMVQRVTTWLRDAGIQVSWYVLLGLGGRDHWQRHIRRTAWLINTSRPDFVRLRRLWLYREAGGPPCPLWEQVRDGSFVEQTPEGTVLELKLLLELLEPLDTFFVCDHANNYINVSGSLQEDREEMLAELHAFLALPEEERWQHYRSVGSRI
ncbi:radical SAM protein [Desulfolithobacter dissulfuricans]|uniref:Radical SAM protein n=2 Tax=Desulfolithobacter dissulfuricans TaxID=2795293 RepID=A0A915U2P7_9BACT|nr:radical SAM protein [Desulfolithobacter dissulfuricans]